MKGYELNNIDPKKYEAGMSILEKSYSKDQQKVIEVNKEFSFTIESVEITGKFHRILNEDEIYHFLKFSEGFISDPQAKLMQQMLSFAYYKSYNKLPKLIVIEIINHIGFR